MINIEKYGWSADQLPEGAGGQPARILAVHKERYEIACRQGIHYARLKSSIYYQDDTQIFPTIGDFVLIQYNPDGDSQILKTFPRRTFFARLDPTPGRGEQAVAANFDYVFIMQSLNHDLNENRLERYLTLAWQSGAMPVVLLTKADLAPENTDEAVAQIGKAAVGVPVHAISAKTGMGLSALTDYLKPGKTIVLLGSSGIGKSSLVNALTGDEIMKVNDIRADDSRGRHTTTHRQMIMLPCQTMIIDTPGMRELGMWDAHDGLDETFQDIKEYLGQCRFSDCRHNNEPGCAVHAAIASGALSSDRWERYLSLKKEAQFADDKAAFLRSRQQKHKSIAKQLKQKKRTERMR